MLKIIIRICLIALLCCLGGAPFALNTNIQTTVIKIKEERVKDSLKIAVVADLHSCDYGTKLIKEIDKQNPDIILLAGDIIDDDLPQKHAKDFFEHIKKYKSFYVTGNHEFWTGDIKSIKDLVRSTKTHLLDGKCESVKDITICGIDDSEIGEQEFSKQLEQTKEAFNYSILLAHRPEYFEKYLTLQHDLIISGHAHGGQWRLPFVLENGLYAPNQGFFPKYTKGLHQKENTKFIISRGLSKESTRIPRIFNRPELVIIQIN